MSTLVLKKDERVADVKFVKGKLRVDLRDGWTIIVPLAWYPRLLHASSAQRKKWQVAGGGFGIHWPELDEDLSTEGLLRGAPAPGALSGTNGKPAGQRGRKTVVGKMKSKGV